MGTHLSMRPVRTFFFRLVEVVRMKCITVSDIGQFRVEEKPVQHPGPTEVLVKVEVAGMCRTDVKLIRLGHRDLVLPRVPGEEVTGTVYEKGAAVTSVDIGDRVYVYPGLWCGTCTSCAAGAENLCTSMSIMGFHRDGGFAEFVTVEERSLICIPDNLPAEIAVFAEPLSCCINALELGGVSAGKRIGIWGAGVAGTLLSRAAIAFGAYPESIEPDERRRKRIGGVSSPAKTGYDITVVAVGLKSAYTEALAALRPRGRLVVFSGLSPSDAKVCVDFNGMHYLEQSLIGAYGCCYRHGKAALDLLAKGAVAVADLISHRVSLWNLEEAIDIVEKRVGMKILLYPR